MRRRARRRFPDLLFDFLDNRLNCADHKGRSDKDQRDQDADPGIGDLQTDLACQHTECAVRGMKRGQRDACNRRGQREGQIDRCVDDPPPRKAIAHEHPSEDDAEGKVEKAADSDSRNDRSRAAQTRSRFTVSCTFPMPNVAPFIRRARDAS